MEEWGLILTKVSNSSPCAFNLTPSCFVKKLVLQWLHHLRLLFPLYWLFKFPNLNKIQTLYTTSPPATTLSHLLTSARFLKSYLHGYSHILTAHICSNIQYNMTSSLPNHPTESVLAKKSIKIYVAKSGGYFSTTKNPN